MGRKARQKPPVVQVEWDYQEVRYRFGLAPNGQLFTNPPIRTHEQRAYDSLAGDGNLHPAVALIDRFVWACRGVYVASDGLRSEAQYLAYWTAEGTHVRIIVNFARAIAEAQLRHLARTGELAHIDIHLPGAFTSETAVLLYMRQMIPATIFARTLDKIGSKYSQGPSWRVTGHDSPALVDGDRDVGPLPRTLQPTR